MIRRFLPVLAFLAASSTKAGTSATPQELMTEARSLAREGKFDAAIKDLGAALFLDRSLPGAWTLLGFCQELNGDPDRAVKSYQSALDLNAGDDFARTHLLKLASSRLPPEPEPGPTTEPPDEPAESGAPSPAGNPARKAPRLITVSPYVLDLLRTGNLDVSQSGHRYGLGIEIVRRPRSGVGLGVNLGHRTQFVQEDRSSLYSYYGSSATAWSKNDSSLTFLSLGPRFYLEFGSSADLAFAIGFGGAYWTRTTSYYERYYDDWSLSWYEYSSGPRTVAGTGVMMELGSDFRVRFTARFGLSFKTQFVAAADNPSGLGVGGSFFWLP